MLTAIILSFAMSGAESGPSVEYTIPTVVVVVQPPAMRREDPKWVCSAPRRLASSATQTVKECDWR